MMRPFSPVGICRSAWLALAAALSACATDGGQASAGGRGEGIEAYFAQERRTGFSGVVLIAQDDRPIVRAAYSDDPRVTVSSRFWIGSLTKPILAAAILKLQEQRRLSVGDPIARFLPDVPDDKRAITIHQLLTHTSGLPHAYRAEGIVGRDEAVRAILALPLRRAPGLDASYSNDGFSLLAAIVERASGTSYEDYIERAIFRVAGMRDSGFWPPVPGASGFAPIAAPPEPRVSGPNWGYRGASGIYSTADDLLRFLAALRDGRIVSPASVDLAMGTRFSRPVNGSIGYGWFVGQRAGQTTVSHPGAEDGLRHFGWIYWLPASRTSVILLSTNEEDRAKAALGGLLRVLLPGPAQAAAPPR